MPGLVWSGLERRRLYLGRDDNELYYYIGRWAIPPVFSEKPPTDTSDRFFRLEDWDWIENLNPQSVQAD